MDADHLQLIVLIFADLRDQVELDQGGTKVSGLLITLGVCYELEWSELALLCGGLPAAQMRAMSELEVGVQHHVLETVDSFFSTLGELVQPFL